MTEQKLIDVFVSKMKQYTTNNENENYSEFYDLEKFFWGKIEPKLKGFKKEFERDGARTLSRHVLTDTEDAQFYVYGRLCEDYYVWVNFFCAVDKNDPTKYVIGNFEHLVCASDEETYNRFLKENPYSEWDYQDI